MIKKYLQVTVLGILALSMMAFSPLQVGTNSTYEANTESFVQQSDDLSDEVVNGLLLMREEEKLAHDVYVFLYDKWGLNIFGNIANSEQTHMDAVKLLLDDYGLMDPAAGKAVGEFANPEMQSLYNQLTTQGNASLVDALKVGAAIEEIDILDLKDLLGSSVAADIQLVYQNLEKGSENHLRSFTRTLETQTGEVYQPQYMNQEEYQAIINSENERGGNGQNAGNGQGVGIGQGSTNGQGLGDNQGVCDDQGLCTEQGTGEGQGYRGGKNK